MVAPSGSGSGANRLSASPAERKAKADAARQRSQQLRARAEALRDSVTDVWLAVEASRRDGSHHDETVRELQVQLAGLRKAMATRAVIEQAKGIVMARESCSSDEAFDILVKMSQRQHLKLRDIAEQLTLSVDQNRLKSV